MSTFNLISIGIILACVGFYFQNKNQLLASLFALTGAGFLLVAAGRMRQERKKLKEDNKNKKNGIF